MDLAQAQDCYRRYKQGTNSLVQHLADAALDCSAVLSQVMDTAETPTTGQDSPPVFKFSTRQLRQLAKDVAMEAMRCGCPPSNIGIALTLVESVIRGRRECALYHKQGAFRDDKEVRKDLTHAHFFDTLHSIRADLLLANKEGTKDVPVCRIDQHRRNIPSKSNFSSLAIEDTADVETENPIAADLDDHPKIVLRRESIQFSAEIEDDEEQQDDALISFFDEVNQILQQVDCAWQEYKHGRLSLHDVVVVAEAASGLLRNATNRLTLEWPGFSDFESIIQHLQIRVTAKNGVLEAFTCRVESSSCEETEEARSKKFYIPAWTDLSMLRQEALQGRANVSKAMDTRCGMPKHIECGHRLIRTLYDAGAHFQSIARPGSVEAVGFCDVFTRLYTAFSTSEHPRITLDLVLNYQMQRNIFDILGAGRTQHFALMHRTAAMLHLRYQAFDYMTALRGHDLGRYESTNRKKLEKQIIAATNLRPDLSHGDEQNGSLAFLLVSFPILAGVHLRGWMELYHEDGILLCNNGDMAQSIAHLYKECRRDGALTMSWPDMEAFLSFKAASQIGLNALAPKISKPELSVAKNFGIALGTSVLKYSTAAIKRNGVALPMVPLPQAHRHAIGSTAAIMLSGSAITTLPRPFEVFPAETGMPAALRAVAQDVLKRRPDLLSQDIKKQLQAKQLLSPQSMLMVLQTILRAEESHFAFDLLAFWTVLRHAFQSIKGSLQRDLNGRADIAGLDGEMEPAELVHQILWSMARRGEQLRRCKPQEINSLVIAGGAIKDVISRTVTDGKSEVVCGKLASDSVLDLSVNGLNRDEVANNFEGPAEPSRIGAYGFQIVVDGEEVKITETAQRRVGSFEG